MENDNDFQSNFSGSGRRTFVLAAVIVLLSVSVALSGWLIVNALNKIDGTDPFEANHTYEGDGTITVDNVVYDCVCSAESKSISETSAYTVLSVDVHYVSSAKSGSILAEIMFDSNRVPISGYTHVGTDGEYEIWQRSQEGIVYLYSLDNSSILRNLSISSDSLDLQLALIN